MIQFPKVHRPHDRVDILSKEYLGKPPYHSTSTVVQVSSEKGPLVVRGCFGCIGDENLPSYLGLTIAIIRIPINQLI